MPVRSWRTGYGPSGGFAFSHETADGILVYSKSVEHGHHFSFVEFVPGLRLKMRVYHLTEWIWGHGLGLIKIPRGQRIEFVGVAPEFRPPLDWY